MEPQGSVKLYSDARPHPDSQAAQTKRGHGSLLFELEFNDTRVEFESRDVNNVIVDMFHESNSFHLSSQLFCT